MSTEREISNIQVLKSAFQTIMATNFFPFIIGCSVLSVGYSITIKFMLKYMKSLYGNRNGVDQVIHVFQRLFQFNSPFRLASFKAVQ